MLSFALLEEEAILIGAELRWAALYRTILRGAKLTQANVTEEELEKSILEGATMPNGQKYEDWLKDR